MLILTNRAPLPSKFSGGVGGSDCFAEVLAPANPAEVRVCEAEKKGGAWRVKPVAAVAAPTPPRKIDEALAAFRQRMLARKRHGLVFVHGFGKTFLDALEQGRKLETRYGIEVAVFTWPASPPGGLVHKYREARRIALASAGALDECFEAIGEHARVQPFDQDSAEAGLSVNLMVYSMGNQLLQALVASGLYAGETRSFSNVVLAQADVDLLGHEAWVDQVAARDGLYVTMNESDSTLGYAESFNGRDRLGRTATGLVGTRPAYYDFSAHLKVGNEHQLWGKVNFAPVTGFFRQVFTGGYGETATGWIRNDTFNRFELKRRLPYWEKPPASGASPFPRDRP